jgi:hypothetical protein
MRQRGPVASRTPAAFGSGEPAGSEILSREHEFRQARKRGDSKCAGSGDPAYSKDAIL